MADTSIEWATKVWNPVRGCSIVSAGCRSCYAMKQAHRFAGPGGKYEGLTQMSRGGPVWTGEVRVVPEMLEAPLHWRKPQRVFVNSMSDLFHEDVPEKLIDRVFAVMALCPQHTFQVLTKRPERMRHYLSHTTGPGNVLTRVIAAAQRIEMPRGQRKPDGPGWLWRNVWLGVSVEDQATADERIPLLLETPAALRWISFEPALGPVDFSTGFADRSDWCDLYGHDIGDHDGTCMQCSYDPDRHYLDWIVVGGESGPGARPFDVEWARSTVEQCKEAGVSVFVKQLGARPVCGGQDLRPARSSDQPGADLERFPMRLRDRKGGDMEEWPADLRIREWPLSAAGGGLA